MVSTLTRNWWAIALRGVLAIIFGVLAFVWPGNAILTLVILFGAYALIEGVFAVVAGVMGAGGSNMRWFLVLEGIAGIVIGAITLVLPGVTTLILLYFIGAWAIVTGILKIISAVELRKQINNEWMMIAAGAVSVLFGLYVSIFPGDGALALIWLIAFYAVVFGIVLVALGFRLRGMNSTLGAGRPGTV